MPRNSVATREIRENGGESVINRGIEDTWVICGKADDCGYDTNEWRFDGGISDDREISWDDEAYAL